MDKVITICDGQAILWPTKAIAENFFTDRCKTNDRYRQIVTALKRGEVVCSIRKEGNA